MAKHPLPTTKSGVTVTRYANEKAQVVGCTQSLPESVAQFGMSTHLRPNVVGFSPILSTFDHPCDMFMSCSGEGSHCPADSTED